MLTLSDAHRPAQRTARVARSYWRCDGCGAHHALDVQRCPACGGPDAFEPAPRRGLRLRHWLALVATWAAATVAWLVASGLLTGGA